VFEDEPQENEEKDEEKKEIEIVFEDYSKITKASGGRIVGDLKIFESQDESDWEEMYQRVMDKKYAKGTRSFQGIIKQFLSQRPDKKIDQPQTNNPPIFMIPRQRGCGYLNTRLTQNGKNINNREVLFAPISKGFSGQDVSSFSVGPIVGQGLCLVNACFSKVIAVHHIEGGGKMDLSRKNFWKRSRKPSRQISVLNSSEMLVDGKRFVIRDWLRQNEKLWLEEWTKWSQSVALCSLGNFHWSDMSETISFRKDGEYLSFVEWKKESYIRPSYQLLSKIKVFTELERLWKEHKVILGLVHPKAISEHPETPVTYEQIKEVFDSTEELCCQPRVICGKLLGVPID